jgi:hypothetical protein
MRLIASFILILCNTLFAQEIDERPAYLNPDLSIEARADDLVSRMTLEEKVSQIVNGAKAIPRLHIPEYNWWNECLHGVARSGNATVFPQAIGRAATWNTDLMLQVAQSAGRSAEVALFDRHTNSARAYERQRTCSQLGKRARSCNPSAVVPGRGGRHSIGRRALWRLESGGVVACNLLQIS